MENASQILPLDLLNQVQCVIDGNQVKGEELDIISSKVEPFELFITVKWRFFASWSDQEIAGGRASDNHYGYNLNKFKEYHQYNLRTAANNLSLRKKFLTNLKNEGVEGLLISKSKTVVVNLGTHSYSYDCNHCNASGFIVCISCGGYGKNHCYSCGGSGQKQEAYNVYDSYSRQNTTHFRWVNCNGCMGSGRITCGGCGGLGRVTCTTCSGRLFFTLYRTTKVVAEPMSHYEVCSALYASQIAHVLANEGHDFTFSRVNLTHYDTNSPSANSEQFKYYGNSYVTEIETELRSNKYTIVGLGYPIYPFIRPAIFDYLFKEEITELLEIKSKKGKIRKRAAVKFFDHFINQPVLSEAFKTIAKERTHEDMTANHIIAQACHGYISEEASETFSEGVTAILDMVSPPYHNFTWLIWRVFSIVFVILWVEAAFEHSVEELMHGWTNYIVYILYSLLGLLIFYSIFTLPILGISAILTAYKRRNVPEKYRQSMRHKAVFKKSLKAMLIAWIIGSFYGFSAGHRLLPQLGYQPFNWAYQTLLSDELKTQFDQTCVTLFQPVHYYPETCKYLKQQNPMTKILEERKFRQSLIDTINTEYISKSEKIYAIQTLLNQTYPEVEVDGIYGKITQKKSVEFLQSQSIPIDEDANLNEIIEAFIVLNRRKS